MTENEKIIATKILLDEIGNEDDRFEAEITVYLTLAAQSILNKAYPFRDTTGMAVPAKYEGLQCEIATYLYNKKGAEGQDSHTEGDIKRTYESAGVPDSMLRTVIPFGGVL